MQSVPDVPNKRILEVGCGTGAFTKAILRKLKPGDIFHIVELSTDFCEQVELKILEPFRKRNPEIEIVLHNAPIEDAGIEGQFDAIICGLPFNNFPVKIVQHLFDVMIRLLKPNAELAYFEYLGLLKLKRVFGLPKVRKETKLRTKDIDVRIEEQQGTQEKVWRNIPSCRVIRLRSCR